MSSRLAAGLLLGTALVAWASRPPRLHLWQGDLQPAVLRADVARTLFKPVLPALITAYWLRTLNAIGLSDTEQKNRALYSYGRMLTELDPRFYHVYLYVGLNVPYVFDRNKWANGDLAADILRRGVERFPDDLRLNLYLGHVLFQMLRDFEGASRVFSRMARLPGAPAWVAPFALRLLAQAGKPGAGIALGREFLSALSEDEDRGLVAERIKDLEVEEQLVAVDKAVAAFTSRTGRAPETLQELRAGGDYTGPETDVRGGTLFLSEGSASSTSLTRRLRIYE